MLELLTKGDLRDYLIHMRSGEEGGDVSVDDHPPELLSSGGLWHGLLVQQGLCPQRPSSKEHLGL